MAPKLLNLSSILILFVLNISSYAITDFHNFIGAQKGDQATGLVQLKKYLWRVGYINNNNINDNRLVTNLNNDLFDFKLESALKLYQEFFHLPVTGILDPQTVKKLSEPRCGVSDYVHNRNISLKFTFFPGQPRWSQTSLTYAFSPGTREDVMHPIEVSLLEWARVSNFRFTLTQNYADADIKISFQVGEHGDGAPFDGPRGILAHAFAPSVGILHYDGDEDWVDGTQGGRMDLQTVAMHELGHILGLGHSSDPQSLMYPSISEGQRKGIGQDDIEGIQSLYDL